MRVSYHFQELQITSYPYEIDNYMHLRIDLTNKKDEEHILHEIAQSIKYNKKIENKRK